MDKSNLTEMEKQAAVPYFIHEGDMTRMDMAMDKLLESNKNMLEANKHMRDALRLVCITLIAVVVIFVIGFVIGYTVNNNNWIRYAETLQTEDANHGEQQAGVYEFTDPGNDP